MDRTTIPHRSPFAPHRWPFHFLLYVQIMAAITAVFLVATFGSKWGASSSEKGFAAPAGVSAEK